MGHTKGTSIVEIVKFLRTRRSEAQQALPAGVHHYLDDRILESAWYPEEDLVAMVAAMVELQDAPAEDTLASLGAEAMQRNRSGAYAHLFQQHQGERVLRVAGVLWKAMHDTGKLCLVRDAVGRGRCELIDFVNPSGEMCGILVGYAHALLELTGYREIQASQECCLLQGDDCCAWSFTWSEPA